MSPRNARLRKIMHDRIWGAKKVAALLNRQVGSVHKWLANQREIPEHALAVLETLAAKERQAVGV